MSLLFRTLALLLIVLLQACGGSSGESNQVTPPPAPAPPPPTAGMLQFDAATYEVDESTQTASFTVTRSGGSDGTVTVEISTSDGTAVAGEDYGATTTTATFADGDTGPKSGTFVIFDDSVHEPDETVILTLSAVTGGATLGTPATAVVTIIDDDPAPRTVSGTVEGLAGSGLVLRNNDGDDVPIAISDTSFQFPTPLFEGDTYNVTVATQPWATAQSCNVTDGAGVVSASDVTDVRISCVEVPLQSLVVYRNIGGQTDILVMREDGTDFVTLADSVDPESMNGFAGDRIVFSRHTGGGTDIYSILPDGSDLVPLATDSAEERFGGIAGNGSLVVFDRRAGLTAATDDIYVIGVDGSGLIALATSADDEEFRGVATSDSGERIIYKRTVSTQDDLYSVNLDGSDPIAIADSTDTEILYAITPGGRIIFQRLAASGYDLYSVNADGTDMVALSTKAGNDEFVTLLDDNRVLYRHEASAGQYDLYAVNADGTEHATIADSTVSEQFAGATPLGRVVYSRLLSGHNDLYAVNPDGTGLSTIAATPFEERFVGTMAGEKIIYLRADTSNPGLTDLFVVNADGSGARQLTDTPAEAESLNSLVFLAGDRLIFTRETGGQDDLYSMLPDGTDERRLTDTEDNSVYPVGATTSGGVIYMVAGSNGSDLYRIGADGNGFVPLGTTLEAESLRAIF